MPDSPISVKWLNDRERAIAVQRVAENQLGVKNSTYSFPGTALTTLLIQSPTQITSSGSRLVIITTHVSSCHSLI
jgi:hypothetical protein